MDNTGSTTANWGEVIRRGYELPSFESKATLPDAVRAVGESVACHLEASSEVRAFLESLPKGKGTYCPDSPIDELVSYVARMVGVKGIDKSDPLINLGWMREIMFPVFEFEREQMETALLLHFSGSGDPEHQRILTLVVEGRRLAPAVDRLFLRLFEKLVVPYQLLSEEDRKAYDVDMANQLSEYDYTVFDAEWDNGHYGLANRVTWAEAFSDEIREIGRILRDLIRVDRVRDLPELHEYFALLGAAYTCSSVDKLEERWRAVDEAWVKLGYDLPLIPVHGMETYNAPCSVNPEFRLEARTPASQNTISRARTATMSTARDELGFDDEMTGLIQTRLNRTDIMVSVAVYRSGFTLNFPMTGQSVPNRQEVQNQGAKIFINPLRESMMAGLYGELADQYLTSEAAKVVGGLINPRVLRMHTILHEDSHPLGRTQEIDAALGSMADELEEAKASLVGMLTGQRMDSSAQSRMELVAVTVARMFRVFQPTVTSNPTFAPYVRENRAAACTLFQADILSFADDGKLDINWDVVVDGAWWRGPLVLFCRKLTTAYRCKSPEEVQKLSRLYCQDPRVQEIVDYIQAGAVA